MNWTSKTRVLLAEDHDLVRGALRRLLEAHPDIVVVGEAGTGADALQLAEISKADVVLMDVSMPDMNGLDATAALAGMRAAPKVIVLSGHKRPAFVRRAVLAGARGYVLKTDRPEHLIKAVLEVHRGGQWFSDAVRDILTRMASEPELAAVDPLDVLSPRQRRVLQLIAEGHSNRRIAEALGISESTVDTHRTELMRRLKLHDVASLVRFACQQGIVSVE